MSLIQKKDAADKQKTMESEGDCDFIFLLFIFNQIPKKKVSDKREVTAVSLMYSSSPTVDSGNLVYSNSTSLIRGTNFTSAVVCHLFESYATPSMSTGVPLLVTQVYSSSLRAILPTKKALSPFVEYRLSCSNDGSVWSNKATVIIIPSLISTPDSSVYSTDPYISFNAHALLVGSRARCRFTFGNRTTYTSLTVFSSSQGTCVTPKIKFKGLIYMVIANVDGYYSANYLSLRYRNISGHSSNLWPIFGPLIGFISVAAVSILFFAIRTCKRRRMLRDNQNMQSPLHSEPVELQALQRGQMQAQNPKQFYFPQQFPVQQMPLQTPQGQPPNQMPVQMPMVAPGGVVYVVANPNFATFQQQQQHISQPVVQTTNNNQQKREEEGKTQEFTFAINEDDLYDDEEKK